MYRTIKITRYVVLIMMCVVSCSYQSPFIFEFSDIPEQVYLIPQVNDYELSTVGVFRFARPSYASGEMGKVAAEVLYNELLKKKVFLNIVNETELPYVSVEHMVELARHKGYDLIISGDLLYYFDGSELLPSHIEERIQVVDVPSGKTLWYATAVEVGHPTPPIDFFLFTQEGAGASATTVLFRKNAEKFCTMFLEEPAQVKIDKEKDDDSDGLYNYLDKCPDTPEGVAVDDDGCPKDSDHDGVPDYRDKCPGTPEGVAVDVTGCPLDSDQDGVCDYLDKCPGTPEGIVVDDDGCPKDSDHDGVPYDRDKCPCTPEGVAVDDDGCPKDSDRDGVPDYRDKCPSTPEGVAVDAIGC
ncbi:MAG: thrombospondin type 3 repeat-containing protein, partial [Thermodesulfobacteriota bacterium]|nr:thrombospondin type 3 repeat-containing protein [Thermodesulfobacteriota bacterium]